METFSRICPQCGKEIIHKNKNECFWANKTKRPCRTCAALNHTGLKNSNQRGKNTSGIKARNVKNKNPFAFYDGPKNKSVESLKTFMWKYVPKRIN